jgi:hypothetical protein
MAYCGGNWNNGGNAGVFYVNLNNARSNANDNIGFRAALATMLYVRSCILKGLHPVQGGKRIASPWPLPKNMPSCMHECGMPQVSHVDRKSCNAPKGIVHS